jgi:hypothetical protein
MPCGCQQRKSHCGCDKFDKFDKFEKHHKKVCASFPKDRRHISCVEREECDGHKAFACVVLEITDPETFEAHIGECCPACGIKDVTHVKAIPNDLLLTTRDFVGDETSPVAIITQAEGFAFTVQVDYDDCYFACGYPPLLFVTVCAPDHHNYVANVEPVCNESNTCHAVFRVSLPFQSNICYPQVTGTATDGSTNTLTPGKVQFNILAIGQDCVPQRCSFKH